MRKPVRHAARAPLPHLQAGEDPSSEFIDDAVHWHNVYSALMAGAATTNLPDKVIEFADRRDFWWRRWKALRDRQP